MGTLKRCHSFGVYINHWQPSLRTHTQPTHTHLLTHPRTHPPTHPHTQPHAYIQIQMVIPKRCHSLSVYFDHWYPSLEVNVGDFHTVETCVGVSTWAHTAFHTNSLSQIWTRLAGPRSCPWWHFIFALSPSFASHPPSLLSLPSDSLPLRSLSISPPPSLSSLCRCVL